MKTVIIDMTLEGEWPDAVGSSALVPCHAGQVVGILTIGAGIASSTFTLKELVNGFTRTVLTDNTASERAYVPLEEGMQTGLPSGQFVPPAVYGGMLQAVFTAGTPGPVKIRLLIDDGK